MADDLSTEQIATITAYVDVDAPPPNQPCAVFIFGTNQATPADIAADRYHRGLAPLIIVTGGINRHTGIIEGQMFRQWLIDRAVPDAAIRHEDRSANTWQNVEFALPHLREAVAAGLPITGVCKWYHRRAIHTLRTLLPEVDGLYALTWEPRYAGTLVTRTNWPDNPDGRRRVIRESQEVPRRVADGSFKDAALTNGTWR